MTYFYIQYVLNIVGSIVKLKNYLMMSIWNSNLAEYFVFLFAKFGKLGWKEGIQDKPTKFLGEYIFQKVENLHSCLNIASNQVCDAKHAI